MDAIKEKLLNVLRSKVFQTILVFVLGFCGVFFDATSIDSQGIRALVGLFFGASIASLAFRNTSDYWVSKVAPFGFGAFGIIAFSIFTFFSPTAQFSAWLVLVALTIFLSILLFRH